MAAPSRLTSSPNKAAPVSRLTASPHEEQNLPLVETGAAFWAEHGRRGFYHWCGADRERPRKCAQRGRPCHRRALR